MFRKQLIGEASTLSDLALQWNIRSDLIAQNGYDTKYQVIANPSTDWAMMVDAIEEPFAPIYDEEEYQNRALNLMGGYEMLFLQNSLGNRLDNPDALLGMRALDLGSGTGRIATALLGAGAAVTTLDATEEYVRITAQKLAVLQRQMDRAIPFEALVVPAEEYDVESESFDSITAMFAVINHVEGGYKRMLPKISEALVEGGKFTMSSYGSNDALVFRLMGEGRLPYTPSILVRRTEGGLLLGDDAKEVLPATFPNPEEIAQAVEDSGLKIKKMRGMLRLAALFPQDPTPENIQKFMEIVAEVEPRALEAIAPYTDNPDQLLMATFYEDMRPYSQAKLNEFAYVAVSAEK